MEPADQRHRDEADAGDARAGDRPALRRPYTPPRLIVFGPIGRITNTVGRRGRRDAPRTTRRTGF